MNSGTLTEQVAEIRSLVNEFALTAPTPPEALPPISEDDVHLVSWMAIGVAGEDSE